MVAEPLAGPTRHAVELGLAGAQGSACVRGRPSLCVCPKHHSAAVGRLAKPPQSVSVWTSMDSTRCRRSAGSAGHGNEPCKLGGLGPSLRSSRRFREHSRREQYRARPAERRAQGSRPAEMCAMLRRSQTRTLERPSKSRSCSLLNSLLGWLDSLQSQERGSVRNSVDT